MGLYMVERTTSINTTPVRCFFIINDTLYNTANQSHIGSWSTTPDHSLTSILAGEKLPVPLYINFPHDNFYLTNRTHLITEFSDNLFGYDSDLLQVEATTGSYIALTNYTGISVPAITLLTAYNCTADSSRGALFNLTYTSGHYTPSAGDYIRISPSIYCFPSSIINEYGNLDFSAFTTSTPIKIISAVVSYRPSTGSYLYTWSISEQLPNSTSLTNLRQWNNVNVTPYVFPTEQNDPYTGAGYSPSTAPGGLSTGTFDFTENGLGQVHTPGLDLLNSGLITAWNPSKAQLSALASWLWVTTPGQIIQQLFGNPINAIIGLNVVPVQPSVDTGQNTIKFGVEDSGVAAPKISGQYVTVDCGSLRIDAKYGSYMDYAPLTGAELFLPYCGGMQLDVNDVIDKTISVKYQVDVLSGACVAYVFIDNVLHYQKSGACAGTAPITGSQMPNVVSGALSIVGSVAGAVASLGASGAATAAKVAAGIAAGTDVASATTNALKQNISYSGTVSGWAGLLGAQKPYLILTMPRANIPAGQNTLMGYPAWVTGTLGDFTGFTECQIDHIDATRATDSEVEEIKAALQGGVIL